MDSFGKCSVLYLKYFSLFLVTVFYNVSLINLFMCYSIYILPDYACKFVLSAIERSMLKSHCGVSISSFTFISFFFIYFKPVLLVVYR